MSVRQDPFDIKSEMVPEETACFGLTFKAPVGKSKGLVVSVQFNHSAASLWGFKDDEEMTIGFRRVLVQENSSEKLMPFLYR